MLVVWTLSSKIVLFLIRTEFEPKNESARRSVASGTEPGFLCNTWPQVQWGLVVLCKFILGISGQMRSRQCGIRTSPGRYENYVHKPFKVERMHYNITVESLQSKKLNRKRNKVEDEKEVGHFSLCLCVGNLLLTDSIVIYSYLFTSIQ